MGNRWNGTDLQEDLALEQGLFIRVRGRKFRSEEIRRYFGLMKRIRKVAEELSRRDDELIEAVLRNTTLSGAAKELSPENWKALRSYMSQRLRRFKQLAGGLLQNHED